ncbi:MAG: ComEC family competence protein [Chitinophagales bacterium]|nr:ComEC family competence protein [Chitinophagales bacterium]
MFKIVLPILVGVGAAIAAEVFLKDSFLPLLVLSAVSVTAFVYLFVFRKLSVQRQFALRPTEGVAISVVLIAIGYALTWLNATTHYTNHFSKIQKADGFYVAVIRQPLLEKENILTTTAEVEQVYSEGKAINTQGQILLNFLRDSNSEQLQYGDRVVLQTKPEEFDAPQNPGEFDFKLYQSFHRIYHRAFLKPDDWKVLSSGNGNWLFENVYALRQQFLEIIRTYITDKNDFAVASAMLLGYRDFMTDEVVQAYASSGALHVLCVSGLHVGIIFLIMNSLLGWLDKHGTKWRIIKAVFIILFIWFYACLSGLSPSVMRAATMFSMIQTGKVLYRHVNIYNVIAASILVLAVFNPYIVTEIGFRLSYLAVFGIIYLQPKIYTLLVVKNKILNKAWEITAVSIAAQIATFPIGLYYFHQFPNLFFVSNLLVIPLSGFIMYVGVALIALHAVPIANIVLGKALAGMIWVLNQSIFLADKIPYSRTEGISIAMWEMLMIYMVIALGCVYTETKRPKVALATLAGVLLLAVMFSYDWYTDKTSRQLVVYKVKNKKAIALLHNGQVLHDFDEALLSNKSSMLFHVRHHWWSLGVKNEKNISAFAQKLPFGKLISCGGYKVLIVDSTLEKYSHDFENKLQADYVVLSQNTKVYLENLCKAIDFKQLIFDSSNREWRVSYWKKDCEKLKLDYWDVNEKGAFVVSL